MTETQPKLTPDQLTTLAVIAAKIQELGGRVDFVPPVREGPLITAYQFRPQGSTRVGVIEGMAGDLATALRRESVLVKRMPGEGVVAVFVPKTETETLRWQALMSKGHSLLSKLRIPLLFGLDWLGNPFVQDLAEQPHLLVAGSTNSGKSVFVRTLLATIVQYMNIRDVQLVLSDTKGVEFTDFVGTPHLLFERATTPLRTIEQMDWLCKETDGRLSKFGHASVRNIGEYNQLEIERVPYIILVIDELADIVYLPGEKRGAQKIGADKLDYITRKSRAAGIHVIASVQRPSVDVVAGVIKNNFPTRVCFKMPTGIDSRTVLDTEGAEQLIKVGDALFKNGSQLTRFHSGYASASDIRGVIDYVLHYKNAPLLNERNEQ